MRPDRQAGDDALGRIRRGACYTPPSVVLTASPNALPQRLLPDEK